MVETFALCTPLSIFAPLFFYFFHFFCHFVCALPHAIFTPFVFLFLFFFYFFASLFVNTIALSWLLPAPTCLLTPLHLHVLLVFLGLFYILFVALPFLLYTPDFPCYSCTTIFLYFTFILLK